MNDKINKKGIIPREGGFFELIVTGGIVVPQEGGPGISHRRAEISN